MKSYFCWVYRDKWYRYNWYDSEEVRKTKKVGWIPYSPHPVFRQPEEKLKEIIEIIKRDDLKHGGSPDFPITHVIMYPIQELL